MPDGDREHHARHEEKEEHQPESDPGAARALAMLDPCLAACPMQAHRVADRLVVDDRDVLGSHLTHLSCHA